MWIVRLALRRPYTFVVMAILIAILGGTAIVTITYYIEGVTAPVVVTRTVAHTSVLRESVNVDVGADKTVAAVVTSPQRIYVTRTISRLAPDGDTYQAGTLSGNPVAMAAGIATLDILEREKVDLVVVDLVMPEMSGPEFCHLLKSERRTQLIPILMMTSVSAKSGLSFDPVKDGDYLPVEDYVDKPVDPADLVNRVAKLLKK